MQNLIKLRDLNSVKGESDVSEDIICKWWRAENQTENDGWWRTNSKIRRWVK